MTQKPRASAPVVLVASALLASLFTSAHAQWWNPLAPKTFEDCVLQGMKGVNSDQAANAVLLACQQKFPGQANSAPPPVEQSTPRLALFLGTDADRPALRDLIAKIDSNHLSVATHGTNYGSGIRSADFGYHVELEITNRNDFPLSALAVGIQRRPGKCGWRDEDYVEIHRCAGFVPEKFSGKFRCDVPRAQSRNLSACIVGFGIYGTDAQIDAFMREHGIPKLKAP